MLCFFIFLCNKLSGDLSMKDRLKKFASSQEDVFKAYWELTDKEFGGTIDQAKAFYDALQNMVSGNFYDSDDARTAKFMMDSVKKQERV